MAHAWSRIVSLTQTSPFMIGGLLFLVGFLGSAAPALVVGIPLASNHDQFSYLLAADTFASGRLANPSHELWEFFETFHVIVRPTYASKYPPGQGLVLALGQALFSLPIVGIWLTAGLLPAAVYWMCRAWIPGPWAALAGVMSLVQWGFGSYWAQSYWGGGVAAIGGALLFGSGARLWRDPTVGSGLVGGLALVILANSRPFEGLVASGIFIPFVVGCIVRDGRLSQFMRRSLIPAALVLAAGGGWLMAYNEHTTGDPFKLAYSVHEETYSVSSLIPGRTLPARESRHELIRRYHERERAIRNHIHTPAGFVAQGWRKTVEQGAYFLGFFGLPALLGLPTLLRRLPRLAVLVVATTIVQVLSLFTIGFPHYLAPVTAPVYCLLSGSFWQLRERRTDGPWIRRAFAVTAVLIGASAFAKPIMAFLPAPLSEFVIDRAAVEAELGESPGPDLAP